MKISYLPIFLLLYFFSVVGITYANEAENFLDIKSDHLKLDKANNIVNFYGNVMVNFQEMELKTDSLQVTFRQINGKNKIEKILIPTKLQVIKTNTQEIAVAGSGEFNADSKTLTLINNVIIKREDYIIRTNKFIYYNIGARLIK